MEKAVKKAIEGGYDAPKAYSVLDDTGRYDVLILDPLFWQALFPDQKTTETHIVCKGGHGHLIIREHSRLYEGKFCCDCGNAWQVEEQEATLSVWEGTASCFYAYNLSEGWDKAVAYLESLIK